MNKFSFPERGYSNEKKVAASLLARQATKCRAVSLLKYNKVQDFLLRYNERRESKGKSGTRYSLGRLFQPMIGREAFVHSQRLSSKSLPGFIYRETVTHLNDRKFLNYLLVNISFRNKPDQVTCATFLFYLKNTMQK